MEDCNPQGLTGLLEMSISRLGRAYRTASTFAKVWSASPPFVYIHRQYSKMTLRLFVSTTIPLLHHHFFLLLCSTELPAVCCLSGLSFILRSFQSVSLCAVLSGCVWVWHGMLLERVSITGKTDYRSRVWLEWGLFSFLFFASFVGLRVECECE